MKDNRRSDQTGGLISGSRVKPSNLMRCFQAAEVQKKKQGLYVAHGRIVTSSHQITKVKQRGAWLVLGWVTAA